MSESFSKLPGSFWGLTTFFNPAGYKNKVENYRRFRSSNKKQGLKLLCVELAFGDEPFKLTKDDADILIQRRASSILWQKERLLNIGLENLPEDCDKIAWLDADIIFTNVRWIAQTCQALESYVVIQPFSFSVDLPHNVHTIPSDLLSNKIRQYDIRYSLGYKIAHLDKGHPNPSNFMGLGNLGYAWAARKVIFHQCGFYDRQIIGANDSIMAFAFHGVDYIGCLYDCSDPMRKDQDQWIQNMRVKVQGSVNYAPGTLFHLWHGHKSSRLYLYRLAMLNKYNYDPVRDINLDQNECWTWATQKPGLHKALSKYFQKRDEGAPFLNIILNVLYNILDRTIWIIRMYRNSAVNTKETESLLKEELKNNPFSKS